MRTKVKMLKYWNGYGAGDVAGFPAQFAERLVASGIAEMLGDAKPAKAARTVDVPVAPNVADAPAPADDDLETWPWAKLMKTVTQLAKEQGVLVDDAIEDRTTDTLIAYIRSHRD